MYKFMCGNRAIWFNFFHSDLPEHGSELFFDSNMLSIIKNEALSCREMLKWISLKKLVVNGASFIPSILEQALSKINFDRSLLANDLNMVRDILFSHGVDLPQIDWEQFIVDILNDVSTSSITTAVDQRAIEWKIVRDIHCNSGKPSDKLNSLLNIIEQNQLCFTTLTLHVACISFVVHTRQSLFDDKSVNKKVLEAIGPRSKDNEHGFCVNFSRDLFLYQTLLYSAARANQHSSNVKTILHNSAVVSNDQLFGALFNELGYVKDQKTQMNRLGFSAKSRVKNFIDKDSLARLETFLFRRSGCCSAAESVQRLKSVVRSSL